MGLLTYADGAARLHLSDRALAHLQMVITAKFRREEAFLFTWRIDLADGGGRMSIWLDSRIPLGLEYRGSGVVAANETWLDLLFQSANSPGGLMLVDEPSTDVGIPSEAWLKSGLAQRPEPEDEPAA